MQALQRLLPEFFKAVNPRNSIMDRTQGNMSSLQNPSQIDGMGHLQVLGYWPDAP